MVKGAAHFITGQEEGDFARGDSLTKDDRSLAAQRFRQVAPATDENFISRIALRRLRTQVASDHFIETVITAFARDDKAQASFARAMSGQDVPALFEDLLGKTDRTSRPLPKIYRRVWDNTYWWADAVCSRTLGALLWLCLAKETIDHIWQRAERWGDWARWTGPESFAFFRPLGALMKATFRAAKWAAGDSQREERLMGVLEKTIQQLDDLRKE